jgi:hypothetical protein
MLQRADYDYYGVREYLAAGAGGDLSGFCSEVVLIWTDATVVMNTPRYRLAFLHLQADLEAPVRQLGMHAVLWEPGSLWRVRIIDCEELADPMSDVWEVEERFAAEMEVTLRSFSCDKPLFARPPKRVEKLTLDHVIRGVRVRGLGIREALEEWRQLVAGQADFDEGGGGGA